jgi:RNA polymerase sigma factor (sigma-70 family)
MRRNCVRMLVAQRSEWVEEDIETRLGPAPEPSATEGIVRTEIADRLWSAVDRLPERERVLMRALFDGTERSYREVAQDLAMPIGAIGPVRMRALKRLPELLAEVGITVDDLHAVA